MKKTYILFLIFIFIFLLGGCKENNGSDKQLIGFTLYEKNNPIGVSQTFNTLNEIDLNGVYASDDYSFVSIKSDAFFDVKTDSSKLQGDLITKDSICLFITTNYYQAQNVNYKLFLYEIYLLKDGKYSVEYKTDIQLSGEVGDSEVINFKSESIKNNLNYVFTYRINFEKVATPTKVLIKEFNINNELINTLEINNDTNEYRILKDTSYVLIEEYSMTINEFDEEEVLIDYTLLTPSSSKKNFVFRILNENNRIINYQISILFPNDVLELENK